MGAVLLAATGLDPKSWEGRFPALAPPRDIPIWAALGVLGCDAARALSRLGFRTSGWSRTPKALHGIETFHGSEGLDCFLRRTEILVCLLPATPATRGILRLELLRKLERRGAAGGARPIQGGPGAPPGGAAIPAAPHERLPPSAAPARFPRAPPPRAGPPS